MFTTEVCILKESRSVRTDGLVRDVRDLLNDEAGKIKFILLTDQTFEQYHFLTYQCSDLAEAKQISDRAIKLYNEMYKAKYP